MRVKLASVGMRALSVAMPATVRTNDHWRRNYPELVADAEQKTLAQLWAKSADAPLEGYDEVFERYLADPFRGAVERRCLVEGERVLDLEVRAAREALERAQLSVSDLDLIIMCSFLPDEPGIGNATPLARELGTQCPAWNLESACSSALTAFVTASALVRAGEARRVLVVISCSYSRLTDPADTLGWFMGDGCSAFVVGEVPEDIGYLASHSINTASTCGTFFYELVVEDERARMQINCTREAGKILRDTAAPLLEECCRGAVDKAGVTLDDVELFVFNTPTAWYAEFCARTLGVDVSKTVDTYPRYANIGPALNPVNLHEAASTGRIQPGQLVLCYTVGSVSTANATLMRWGDVGLGARPS